MQTRSKCSDNEEEREREQRRRSVNCIFKYVWFILSRSYRWFGWKWTEQIWVETSRVEERASWVKEESAKRCDDCNNEHVIRQWQVWMEKEMCFLNDWYDMSYVIFAAIKDAWHFICSPQIECAIKSIAGYMIITLDITITPLGERCRCANPIEPVMMWY